MSRNSPIGFSGARAQGHVRQPSPDDPFAATPAAQSAPQWPPQYAEPQAQPAFAQHAAPQPAAYAPQPAFGQPQPQPVAFGQPAQPRQPQAFPAQDARSQQQSQGYYFPQAQPEPAPAYAPQPAAAQPLPFESLARSVPALGQQAPQPNTTPRWPSQTDARGLDLGNYMPAAAPSYPAAEAAHFPAGDHDPGALPRQHDPARFDAQHGYGETDADYDELLAEEEEQPRRGRRGMMIAAALVGAIGLGGALAYTYKTFFAASSGPAPRITASNSGPNKVKPVVPDGKAFPNTDKKLLNRLGEEESSSSSGRVVIGVPPSPHSQQDASDDRASDDPSAPRKVRIIPITPNAPPPGAVPVTTGSAAPRAPSAPVIAVPGVTLENLGPPQVPPSAARVPLPQPQPQLPAQAQPQPPPKAAPPAVKVAAAAPPAPAAEPAAPPRKAPPPAAAEPDAKKAPVPKTKTASAAPAASSTASTGSGYVAVLSSKKSRMDALKTFADMQEKYGDVLASKTPDVQESDQSARGLGTMYRLVVGPPGSREAASSICSKLKAAGYKDCWVTQY
jgi:hypothetical protein